MMFKALISFKDTTFLLEVVRKTDWLNEEF